jgi:hypothetical protein
MAETRGGVVAIFDIPCASRKFWSVEGIMGVRQTCLWLREEVGLGGPRHLK